MIATNGSTAHANGRAAILGGRQKPAPMAIEPANLPPELPLMDRWLGWDWELVTKPDGTTKWDKPPRNCLGGPGKSTDPETWCDLSTAIAAAEAGEVDGIGIAPDDLDAFRRSRQVIPDGGLSATQRLRRKAVPKGREYF